MKSFNIDNWRNENDPVLNLEHEEEKTVKESLQEIRDDHSKKLKTLRAERDQNREEAKNNRAESEKTSNKILGLIRSDNHDLHPRNLKSKADRLDYDADLKHRYAKVIRNHLTDETRPEENNKVAEEAINKIFAPLKDLLNGAEGQLSPSKLVKKLKELPRDEIVSLIQTHYRINKKNVGDMAFDLLNDIGNRIESSKYYVYDGQKEFWDFVAELLTETVKINPEVFQNTESFLSVLYRVGYLLSAETLESLGKIVNPTFSVEDIDRLVERYGMKSLESLLTLNSEVAKTFIENITKDSLKNNDSSANYYLEKLQYEWFYPKILKILIKSVGQIVEEEFGLKNGIEMIERWHGKTVLEIKTNVSFIRGIESKYPGSVKLLNEEYGIYEFKRYPEDMLLEQIRLHGQDVPYGVVFYPEQDYNNAFDYNKDIFNQLQEGIKDRHTTRIFEVSKKSDLLRDFAKLRARYKNKISFLIVGGHGQQKITEFSIYSSLTNDILDKSTSIESIKRMFVNKPSIVLISCSTGVEGGLAQKLSEKLDAVVCAPKVATSPSSLSVTYEGDKPVLDMEYSDPQKAAYISGVNENDE